MTATAVPVCWQPTNRRISDTVHAAEQTGSAPKATILKIGLGLPTHQRGVWQGSWNWRPEEHQSPRPLHGRNSKSQQAGCNSANGPGTLSRRHKTSTSDCFSSYNTPGTAVVHTWSYSRLLNGPEAVVRMKQVNSILGNISQSYDMINSGGV